LSATPRGRHRSGGGDPRRSTGSGGRAHCAHAGRANRRQRWRACRERAPNKPVEMILTLALRHLWVRKRRSALLLLGFALGVGVMILLLSVGEAMLDQSRDVALVGGGEVTVLPLGIDVEAMRTGGVSGMFFGIDHARFLTRQLLGGPRHADVVRAVAPAIEEKILYLERRGVSFPVRAGGEIPS